MEQGIYDNSLARVLVVNITKAQQEETIYTANKTAGEIMNAYTHGCGVVFCYGSMVGTTERKWYYPLTYANTVTRRSGGTLTTHYSFAFTIPSEGDEVIEADGEDAYPQTAPLVNS